MEYFLGNAYENTMESYYGVVNTEDVPCEKIYCGCAYFIAMNYVLRGEYSKASEKMDYIMYMADEGISKDLINKSEFSFLQAVKYYVSAMASIDNHEIVMEYLRTLFDEYICNRVDDIFIDQRNVIIKQYPCLTKIVLRIVKSIQDYMNPFLNIHMHYVHDRWQILLNKANYQNLLTNRI